MTRVVVLESLDRSIYVAEQLSVDSGIAELCQKFASTVGVASSDLLFRQSNGLVIPDEKTVAELCAGDLRGTFLTVERKVALRLRLRPETVNLEADFVDKGARCDGQQSPTKDEEEEVEEKEEKAKEEQSLENGVHSSAAFLENSGGPFGKETEAVFVWLSCPAEQLIVGAQEVFALDPKRPLKFFLDGQELNLEKSLEDQLVAADVVVEVQRHLRDIALQVFPPTCETGCVAKPEQDEIGLQCHRVPSMKPQTVVVDCLFPEEGWRSVDETILPEETIRDLIPKAAEQLDIPSEEATYVFQMGITFPLGEATGQATQVMRGSSRKYIDDQGRDIAEVDRRSQTLTPLHPDDLPSAPPIGKPVVNVWRNTDFLEVSEEGGELRPLSQGLQALSDKSFCGFFRGLRISGPPAGSTDDVDLVERTFVRVTALLYVDVASGQPYEDEEAAVRSTEGVIRSDARRTQFFVALVAEGRPLPRFKLPRNRYLALFTRHDEEVELGPRGDLVRRSSTSNSRTWILPREMSQLLRDITRFFLS